MKSGESRTYTVPLRKEYLKTPKWRRSEKAISVLRSFLIRHTKTNEIKIGNYLNEAIWKRGSKNPPSRIRVDVKKENEQVFVELADLSKVKKSEDKKVEKKESKPKSEDKKVEKKESKPKSEDKKVEKKESKPKSEDK
jgi:large subunit ribosomal protein L31e